MNLMFQGVGADSGKTVFTRSCVRHFSNLGYRVAPFKAISVGSIFERRGDLRLDRRMWILLEAAREKPSYDHGPVQVVRNGTSRGTLVVHGDELGSVELLAEDSPILHDLSAAHLRRVLDAIEDAIERLSRNFDIVVLEGAGSPVDLGEHDIANIHVARITSAPILLLAAVSRGGAFSSLAGTVASYPQDVRTLLSGFALNDSRGGQNLIMSNSIETEKLTGLPFLGHLPHLEIYDQIPTGFTSTMKDNEQEYEHLCAMLRNHINVERVHRILGL